MAKEFTYKAISADGSFDSGVYEAASKEELVKILRSRGQRPVKIEEVIKNDSILNTEIKAFNPKVKVKDLVVFCRQLHTMLNAGMPLISSLDVLINQSEKVRLKDAIAEVSTEVKKGKMLSAAMSHHPKIFPKLLVNMIEAGEMTGNLDDVLGKMAEHYAKENKINTKIRGAMIYPIVLGFVALGAVVFMLVVVMPTIVGMFTGSGVALPWPTRLVLGMSNSIQKYWYVYIIVFTSFIVGMKKILSTKKGKRTKDIVLLKLPGIKKSITKIATSRFTRTLSTLLGSGIPILQALEAAANTTNNEIVIEGIAHVSENIKKGDSLSLLIKDLNLFPPMMVSMISIGEESGAIEEMLSKTADYYDEELDASMTKLVALIEPLAILLMAVLIGFIVIAMMLPMFDMFKTIA